ncbi:relaxase domain-containing protein [Streptomyces sp. Qhu_M48]|uniref:relaxase domain-containing protein n=1 Tax=Streptomyces sp. Qhu_M48 TaxID=3435889 RepID=UPI003F4FC674
MQASYTTATPVATGGDKAVVGAVDSGAGSADSFKATPLASSGNWSAGGSSGAFTWSYPLAIPPAPAGPAPNISFNYNSQTVDGRTSVSSPQASWIGEGWDYDPGHIERRYRSCKDDTKTLTAGTPNNTANTSDLCWVSHNAVMSLGGKTTELVRDDASTANAETGTDTYRPQNDDGTRIRRHTGGTNRARRPDGTWGNLSADSMVAHIVAADTLYTLLFMEEVTARLGWAWEPREVTPGRRPVMEIAGIDRRLIGWQSTRRQQIEDALPVLTARYEERQGHAPGERAAYALACQAADQTRPPKRTEPLSLTELRTRWRTSAIRAFGACTLYRIAERARAAAAAVWARVRPVVAIALAAIDVVAVVYVMRGAFARHHLLAEARRHLSYVLRGRPHEPGLDERIVQAVVDDYTRPVGRGRRMTADLRALYPGDTEDQAVLRPLTRSRTAAPYERARLAADALAVRAHAVRRADRLGSRPRPYTVAVPAASRSHSRPFRDGRKDGLLLKPETGVDAVEQTRQTLEAAAAKVAATLQDSQRAREAAHGLRPQPAPAAVPPQHTQQPGTQHTPGRTTGGVT